MSPDHVNALFELGAGVLIWLNVRQILRDKMARGVAALPVGFFALWGVWNLYYYPHLDQVWSFAAGLLVVGANAAWVSLIVYYNRRERLELCVCGHPQSEHEEQSDVCLVCGCCQFRQSIRIR